MNINQSTSPCPLLKERVDFVGITPLPLQGKGKGDEVLTKQIIK